MPGADEPQPEKAAARDWLARATSDDCSRFIVSRGSKEDRENIPASWDLIGLHNMGNAIAAVAAAHHVGIPVDQACNSLSGFMSVKRRLEHLGNFGGIDVYDDFAHHPTAIAGTLSALRSRVGGDRILAVLEPRSNTMKQGVHKHRLKASLDHADKVYFFCPEQLQWDARMLEDDRIKLYQDTGKIIDDLQAEAVRGDNILIMSNGGFENLHQRLISRLSPS